MKPIKFVHTIYFSVALTCSAPALAQNNFSEYYLKREQFESSLPALRNEFGQNKIIPSEVELECLVALSNYPELKNTPIEFRFHRLNFTMTSKPKLSSALKGRHNRQYVVTIQAPGACKTSIDWNELSFNAMVGWIGHELGHIVHYSHKSNGGILFTAAKYAVPMYRRKMERFTDQLAIQHDLGYALYEGVVYTLNESRATEHYKNNHLKYYLHPDEIIQRIQSKESWSAVFRKTKMKEHVVVHSSADPVNFQSSSTSPKKIL